MGGSIGCSKFGAILQQPCSNEGPPPRGVVRAKARDLLHPELAEHGTNQFGKDRGGSITTSSGELGRGETYTIARLKRDRLDLDTVATKVSRSCPSWVRFKNLS